MDPYTIEGECLEVLGELAAHGSHSAVHGIRFSLWDNAFGTGSGFSRRIDRVVRMISNRSVVVEAGVLGHGVISAWNSGCYRS